MEWLRVQLTEEQQRVVNEERRSHPNAPFGKRCSCFWLLHKGFTRQQAAQVVGIGQRHCPAVCGRISRGGLGWTAAVIRQSSGQRNGRLSRLGPRVL